MIVNPDSIPFKESELRQVKITAFPFTEALADLENFCVPSAQHLLHANFRRSMKELVARTDCFDVGFRGRCGDDLWGLHLQIILFDKEIPD